MFWFRGKRLKMQVAFQYIYLKAKNLIITHILKTGNSVIQEEIGKVNYFHERL